MDVLADNYTRNEKQTLVASNLIWINKEQVQDGYHANPLLGWEGITRRLDDPSICRTQASSYGNTNRGPAKGASS